MSAASDFVVWTDDPVPHGCRLSRFEGVEDSWELNKGVPRAADWTGEAVFRMDPESPHDMALADSLENSFLLLVVSERLADLVAARRPPDVEALPVTVLDHRGRPARQTYRILHPTHPVECLDIARCGAERSELDPESINAVERLALDAARLDPERLIFRPLGFYDVTLVRRDLAQAITDAGITGVCWIEVRDYPEA
jgi:hypothetical protein